MNYKTTKALAITIVVIFYMTSIITALALIYIGLSSLTGLIIGFNIKDLTVLLMVVIFFYWIIKTS